MSKKLLALLLALVMIVGSFTSVLAETAKTEEPKKDDSKPAVTEDKKDEKSEEKKDEKSEEKKEEKTEEKTEEKKEEVKDEYLAKAIDVLKKAGFISGYSKDSEDFKAEKNVTRAEFASMIVRVKGLEDSAKALANLPTGFKDVPANLWANGYIAVAKQQGFVNGYPNGTFQPNRQISYQDMATMLTIALGKNEAGTVYPAGYIVKAQQLGLFNNVKPLAYTDMATRGDVFKMVYNMITSKEFAQRKILKAIVLENPRVENLAENQITVEVINVVQKADWVEANRDKRGDQHTYTLEKDAKFDAEGLLGKVVNVTVDKNDKVVDITVDDSYDYLEGTITDVTSKKFELNGNVYSVLFDERYANFDERVYRTYLNDKDYTYEDFATRYKVNGLGDYDYAKLTVKNGKVVFIDAFKFDDVAPVAEVKDGNVWYYDDTKDARLVKTLNNFPDQLLFASKGIFSVGDVKAIAKDDVIHFYNEYHSAIVRKDARINDELVKTSEDRNDRKFLHTKDKAYRLLLSKKDYDRFRPVYSFEGKQFNTLEDRFTLRPITGKKVKVLVALNNTVQLVEGNIAWNDGINGIRKITSRGEVRLIPSKGEEFWASEGRNTEYYDWEDKGDNNKQLNKMFNINDIVYYVGEANKDSKDQTIGKMLNIAKYSTYKNQMTKAAIDARYIEVGATKYRYFDNLHAFYLDKWNNLQSIDDIAQFIAENDKNKELEAYLITEPELKNMYDHKLFVEYYNFLTDAPNVANIVVFDNAKYRGKTDVIYAEVDVKFNYVSTVRFIDSDRVAYDVDLTGDGLKAKDFNQGDIVELHILKDSADKEVKRGYVERVVIRKGQKRVAIKDLPRDAYLLGTGDSAVTRYFDKNTVIFNRQYGDWVQYAEDRDDHNFVRVIRYFKTPDAEPEVKEQGKYNRVYAANTNYPALALRNDVNGKVDAFFVNAGTRFYDEKGSYIGLGEAGLNNLKAAYDAAEVELVSDGKLISRVNVKRTALQIAKDLAAEKLAQAEALLKKLSLEAIDYKQAGGAETTPADVKTIFDAAVTTKLSGLTGVTHTSVVAPAAFTDLANKGADGTVNTILAATASYGGEAGTAATDATAPIKTMYHVRSEKEQNIADAEAIVSQLKKDENGKPFVEVAIADALNGTAIEGKIKTAIKGTAKGTALSLQDADITVSYNNKDYSATFKVGSVTEGPIVFTVKTK